jgi:glycolate oxidase FAD binding subunit
VDSPSIQFDGFGPLPLHQPDSVAAVGELVRQTRGAKQAVYALGGGTQVALGQQPVRPGIVLGTTRLCQVIDYPARDMTITVQAGIRLIELQAILAKENQRLAVDIARADQATLGGALAANASGPRRFGCGTLRDYLIGVSFVNDDGHEIKSGGRVVKNVAGYDMCKLLIGSLGTLGIITQATLKLRPLPEAQALVVVPVESGRIDAALELAHRSQSTLCCVELLNPSAAKAASMAEASWSMIVGFEDNEPSVKWQVQKFQDELHAAGFATATSLQGSACEPAWQALVNFPVRPHSLFRIKVSLPPEKIAELLARIPAGEPEWEIQAHAGNGICLIQCDASIGQARCAALLAVVRDFAGQAGGFAVVEECPSAWKTDLLVWGKSRDDFWLMRRVKAKLDPDAVFSPGRFVDGI